MDEGMCCGPEGNVLKKEESIRKRWRLGLL